LRSQPRNQSPINVRKAEKELTFWTVRQFLKLIIFTALTVWFVVGLAAGHLAGTEVLLRLL
jgi:hypothetical protein